ncbi:MAG: hypothetical protein AB8U82_06245 [Rickettsia endosymbiont of Haemaphysalis japonica]
MQKNGLRVSYCTTKILEHKSLMILVSRFCSSYNNTYTALYTPLLWPEEKAFSMTQNIGEPVIMLGEKTGADIFVLLNYVQMIKTNGARTRDFLMSALGCSVSNADNIFMSIGIVEAKSGRILWTNATPQAQPFSSSIFSSRDKSEIGNFHSVINML